MVLLSYACFHFIHPSLFTFVINTMQVIIVYACMYICMYEHGAFRFSIIESQLCFCLFTQDIYIYMDKPTILKYFFRLKETWKGRQYVKKLLNGGGSLSAKLMKDATELFPRAKLLSAYGSDLSIFVVFFFNIIFWHVIFFLGSIF